MRISKPLFPTSLAVVAFTFFLNGCANFQSTPVESTHNSYFDMPIHPILRVTARQALKKGDINENIFSELNDYFGPKELRVHKQEFVLAEQGAVDHFCSLAIGQNQAQITRLAGLPDFRSNPTNHITPVWNKALPGDQMWAYRFGTNNILATLIFRRNMCIFASRSEWNQDQLLAAGFSDCMYEKSFYHPILHLRSREKMKPNSLKKADYLKLKNFVPACDRGSWRERFGDAELTAAIELSLLVRGKTKEEIKEIIGLPLYQGKNISCWKFAPADHEIWLYRLGGTNVPVRLAFDNDRCIKAEIYSDSEQAAYLDWRNQCLETNSLGKTLSEIWTIQGPPNSYVLSIEDTKSSISRTSQVRRITYNPDNDSREVTLLFENSLCTRVIPNDDLITY